MSDSLEAPRRGSLLVVFLTVFIDLLGFGIVLPLLPIYAKQYDLGRWQMAVLMASFSAMQFIFAPMWGRLSDQVGRRPILMVGLAGSVIFYAMFGVATAQQNLVLLFLSRFGAGVAGATISTAHAYIADCTTLENRQKGMALIGMAFGLGFTFGPLFGFLAVPSGSEHPGPWPGYTAAILSGVALLLAILLLPESRRFGQESHVQRIFDLGAFSRAIAVPSVGLVLLVTFICVFSFANFETTLSLYLKGEGEAISNESVVVPTPFRFDSRQICLSYTFIGLMLAAVQGGLVRRVSGRVSEGALISLGAALQVIGLAGIYLATLGASVAGLFVAMSVVVAGFAFMQPNLNSMLSRRSHPEQQGEVLGIGQRISSLARILGAGVAIPLLSLHWAVPNLVAGSLFLSAAVLIRIAVKQGGDFAGSRRP